MNKIKDNSRVYFGNPLPPAGEYAVDPVHSFAEFATQHLIVGQVRGRFNSISGEIRIADEPLLSSFEFTVDTASIYTHHAGRDACWNGSSVSLPLGRQILFVFETRLPQIN